MEYDPEAATKHGFIETGYSFKNKKRVLPLLAADMLAWATVQELLHATNIRMLEPREARIVCHAFESDGSNGPSRKIYTGYQTRQQLAKWVKDETAFRKRLRFPPYNGK